MDWYFRTEWRIAVKDRRPKVTITGYSILNTLVGVGIALLKYIFRKDQPLLTVEDVIAGALILVVFVSSINWYHRVFSDQRSSLYWLGPSQKRHDHRKGLVRKKYSARIV